MKNHTESTVSFMTPQGPDTWPLTFWINPDVEATEVYGEPILQLTMRDKFTVFGDGYKDCFSKLRLLLTAQGYTDIKFNHGH